ncbi:hypothetical protein ASG67_09660 [Sphingomonas sp. Leaf339]|uniref:hypothetical protein n=1 Tax=Sphingomonas sp. Leaf339 TaxID=1736343 RepID=UPI0006FC582F|nr:hypothetical protein [Sphingomonas sp. Leaf339]KQU53096.1 hypothetical protein ASG67_09660 [Sphingomonas sp. Leaf339]
MSAVVAAAREMMGLRFRLHGRGMDGVDCVGLVAMALDLQAVPTGYGLRGGRPDRVASLLDERLRRVAGRAAGDLLLLQAGPGQLHLAIWTGDGLVHADAGLGRVVERPGEPPWPVIGAWRLSGG